MTLISSDWTLVYKWLFPAVFLFIAVMMIAAGVATPAKWVILAAGVLFLVQALRLAGEVYDSGDALLIKILGKDVRVEIRKISRVDLSMSRPPVVTLHVEEGSNKVQKFRFIPRGAGVLHAFGRGPAQDLMARVREARGNSAV